MILNDDADPEVRSKVNKVIPGYFADREKPSFLLPSQNGNGNSENMKDKVKYAITKNRHLKEIRQRCNCGDHT